MAILLLPTFYAQWTSDNTMTCLLYAKVTSIERSIIKHMRLVFCKFVGVFSDIYMSFYLPWLFLCTSVQTFLVYWQLSKTCSHITEVSF